MITRLTQSWELFKASIAVTLQNRKLLWFPVLTAILTAFIALFFISAMALSLVLHHTGYHLSQKEHWLALRDYYAPHPVLQAAPHHQPRPFDALNRLVAGPAGQGFSLKTAALVVIYFLSMFLATFFNVAFYSEIIAALNGRGVSFRRGLGVARSRLPSIIAWSLLAGLVGWIIRAIEQRAPFIARIFVGLIGTAWSIAAVFAIPVIIQEQSVRNPIKILQQSAMTLRRTWGEGLIGYLGFSAGNMLIFACSLLPLALAGALAYALNSWGIFLVAAALWLIGIMIVGYISSVASHVYRCALYLYAAEGVVPAPYTQNLLDMAWKVRGR